MIGSCAFCEGRVLTHEIAHQCSASILVEMVSLNKANSTLWLWCPLSHAFEVERCILVLPLLCKNILSQMQDAVLR